jgi:amidase
VSFTSFKVIYLVTFFSGSDLGGSVRIPSNYCGTVALKPTTGRIPVSGQGSDGGLVGVVGLYNTLGFMARSAAAVEEAMVQLLSEKSVPRIDRDARFVPLAWRPEMAGGKKLKIGW